MYMENLDAQSKNVDVYSKSFLCIFEKSRIFENTSGFFRLYIKIFEYLSQDSRIYIKIFGTYIIQDFRIQQCFTRHSIVFKLFVSRADYFFLFVRRDFFFKEEIVCYKIFLSYQHTQCRYMNTVIPRNIHMGFRHLCFTF